MIPEDKLLWKPIARVVRMAVFWPLSFQNPWTDFVEVCSVFISLSQVWPHMQIHIVLRHLQWFWWTHYMWHVLAAYKRPSCWEVVDGLRQLLVKWWDCSPFGSHIPRKLSFWGREYGLTQYQNWNTTETRMSLPIEFCTMITNVKNICKWSKCTYKKCNCGLSQFGKC